MPGKNSALIHRTALVISALAIIGIVFWVGKRVLEPSQSSLNPTVRTRVTFNPESDIRENSLFAKLKEFFMGDLETGALGNPSPFIGPNSGMVLEEGQESRLATMEEVALQGAFAQDAAPGSNGGMLILLVGLTNERTATYEIRSYETDGAATTFASWNDIPEPAFTPTAIIQDHNGRVWMGNGEGSMGYVEQGGEPVWLSGMSTGLYGPVSDLVVDTLDKVWVTDGATLAMGDDAGFSPVDLYQQMSGDQQGELSVAVSKLSAEYGSTYSMYGISDVKQALYPERLSVTREGRIGLSTGLTAFHFGLTLQQRPDWINTLSSSTTVPLIVGPNGHVWGRRLEDDVLMRVWATGTRAYTSKRAVPSYALTRPRLFAQNASKLYAMEYSATSTSILWSTQGEEWFSQVVVASGTPPLDEPRSVEVDEEGNVWLLMEQGGIVRIRRSKPISEDETL